MKTQSVTDLIAYLYSGDGIGLYASKPKLPLSFRSRFEVPRPRLTSLNVRFIPCCDSHRASSWSYRLLGKPVLLRELEVVRDVLECVFDILSIARWKTGTSRGCSRPS